MSLLNQDIDKHAPMLDGEYLNINNKRTYRNKVIALLLAVSIGCNCYYFATSSTQPQQMSLAQGDFAEIFEQFAQKINQTVYEKLEDRQNAFDAKIQEARDAFEDHQYQIQHKVDEAMDKVDKVKDFINSVDGLPLDQVLRKTVKAVYYETHNVTVYDASTELVIPNATITITDNNDNTQTYVTDENGVATDITFKRDTYIQIQVQANGYYDYSDYTVDDEIYLIQVQEPLTLTLNWQYSGDYDFYVSTSGGYYFSRQQDIMSPPGGEQITISQFSDDTNNLIYARYFSQRNMTENPATLNITWGDYSESITYNAEQDYVSEAYWLIACVNGIDLIVVNQVTSSTPDYSYCSVYDQTEDSFTSE